MRTRTVSAIYLRPSGNTQGSFYYYSLWSGRRLHRRRRTPLPMSQEIIDRVFAGVHFTKLPKIIVVELVYATIFWYSITIPEDYISITLGLGAIILGRTYDYNMLCGEGLKFGEYVQTHEKTTTTMRTRTVSTICLCPSGNTYGSFYYYSLWPGRCLHRRRRTPLPMSQEIIDRVHYIADKQNSPSGLTFTRQDGTS